MTSTHSRVTVPRQTDELSRRIYELERRIRISQNNLRSVKTAFGTTVVSETTFGQPTIVGATKKNADAGHSHGTPTNPIPAHVAVTDPHPIYPAKDPVTGKIPIGVMPAPIWDPVPAKVPITAFPAIIWDPTAQKVPVGALPVNVIYGNGAPGTIPTSVLPPPIWDNSQQKVPVGALPVNVIYGNGSPGTIPTSVLPPPIWDNSQQKVPLPAIPNGVQLTTGLGAANGYAPLDGTARVPVVNQATGTEYTVNKAQPNGYADLNSSGLLPVGRLPAEAERTTNKNTGFGYPGLDGTGRINDSARSPNTETYFNKGVGGGYAGLGFDGRIQSNNAPATMDVPFGTAISFRVGGSEIACIHNPEFRATNMLAINGTQGVGNYNSMAVKSKSFFNDIAGFGANIGDVNAVQFRIQSNNGDAWVAMNNGGSAGANIFAANFFTISSERIKNNIREIVKSDTNKFMGLHPVKYTKDRISKNATENVIMQEDSDFLGLIAEEVALIYPEIVAWDIDKIPFAVDYMGLIPILIAQVQLLTLRLEKVEVR